MLNNIGFADDSDDELRGQAKFMVFGVGGGGGNAVEHMVQHGIVGVTFVAANTDLQALRTLSVPNKIQLGLQTTKGLGSGGDPEKGRESATNDEEEIRAVLKGHDMLFITAGMGGGTGTGAAPVVARIAKEMEILTVAVVTTPFNFEGKRRMMAARAGLEQLTQYVDAIITIPNEKLLQVYRQLSVKEAFKKADDVLLHAVSGLVKIVDTDDSIIHTDFMDVRTAMTAKGHAMMGVGRASGEDRARQATEKAIRSPLLDDIRLENAKGLLINITAAELMLHESEEISIALESITDLEEGNIFYGFVQDDSMGDDIHVTVIATGLTVDDRPKPASKPASPNAHIPNATAPAGHVSAYGQMQSVHQQYGQSVSREPQAQVTKTPRSVSDYLREQTPK